MAHGGFIATMGRSFGTTNVVVVHQRGQEDEERHELEAQVQGSKAYFDIDAPVYDGDEIEIPDPRGAGGTRTVYVTNVKINQAPMSSSMSHLAVSYSATPPVAPVSPESSQVFNGPVVVVSGSHVNVAFDKGKISQQQPVSPGYEQLAQAVGDALKAIEATHGLDPDERENAREASAAVLGEVVKPDPDRSIVKRGLAMLRGTLQAAIAAGAGAVAKGLIEQLFV
ncbi:hypothetical protein [Agromyces sp. NPDC057865]|uniref:hypothetical protein n=1 Tax=Agromyces sp. NPDC057865 TaxID=3346267 RepID=UPI0036710195